MGQEKSRRASIRSLRVGIVMGSQSDLKVMKEAFDVLEQFGVGAEITVVSAHRTPDRMVKYAKDAAKRGLKIIIAGAGGAAHLPGMLAAFSSIPVIGVPIHSANSVLGIDSLLSIAQMPAGIPVATVAINGAKNAGILAAMIIALNDRLVASRIEKFKEDQRRKSHESVSNMIAEGLPNYFDHNEKSKER